MEDKTLELILKELQLLTSKINDIDTEVKLLKKEMNERFDIVEIRIN